MTTDSFVLVNSGDPRDRVGGARLRWDVLADGFARLGELHRFEPHCDGSCGRPHPEGAEVDAPVRWMPRFDPYSEFYCPEQSRLLRELVDRVRPTLVAGSGLEMARYLSELDPDVRTVIDFKDVDSDVRRDMLHATEAENVYSVYRTGDYERFLTEQTIDHLDGLQRATAAACSVVWTTTDRDRGLVLAKYGTDPDKVLIVPNAVRVPPPVEPPVEPPTRVVFIGKLNYLPCVQACRFVIEELAPLLRRDLPGLEILLVGAQPPAEILEAAGPAGVRVVADPPDVTPYWEGSILVVPLTVGGGSRLKIMEAFAHHSPVVTTAKGVEGIKAVEDKDYLAAETAEEFAGAIRRLIADDALRVSLLRSAREFVGEHNSVDNVTRALAATVERLS
jgi:polysaccharide biosynthesis protein PslH